MRAFIINHILIIFMTIKIRYPVLFYLKQMRSFFSLYINNHLKKIYIDFAHIFRTSKANKVWYIKKKSNLKHRKTEANSNHTYENLNY
jgi:hypothetical protein